MLKVTKVNKTKKYDIFKCSSFNRDFSINKVLEKDLLINGIQRPIEVSPDGEIVDGQHRYAIAVTHGLEIPYVVTTLNKFDISRINNLSMKWKTADYGLLFLREKKKHYITFYRLKQNQNLLKSEGAVLTLLKGNRHHEKHFKKGTLTLTTDEIFRFELNIERLKFLRNKCPSLAKRFSNINWIANMVYILGHPDFIGLDQMVDVFNKAPITPDLRYTAYISLFLNNTNKNNDKTLPKGVNSPTLPVGSFKKK